MEERDATTEHLWRRYAVDGWSIREIAEEAEQEPAAIAGLLLRAYGDAYWKATTE